MSLNTQASNRLDTPAARAFLSRLYGADAVANLANLETFRIIFAWIMEKNNARELPEWSGGRLTAILPTLTAYPVSVGTDAARYQIQLKALYKVG